jgi:hypothetical protein
MERFNFPYALARRLTPSAFDFGVYCARSKAPFFVPIIARKRKRYFLGQQVCTGNIVPQHISGRHMRMSRGSKSASRNCVRKDGADRTAKSAEMPTLGRLIAKPTGVEGFTFVRSAHAVWEEADSKRHRHHVDRRRLQLSAAIAVRKLGVMKEAGQRPTTATETRGSECDRSLSAVGLPHRLQFRSP